MAKVAKDFTFLQNFCVSNHMHNLYKGKLKHKNYKKNQHCSCRKMLMLHPVKPAVSEWDNKSLKISGRKTIL